MAIRNMSTMRLVNENSFEPEIIDAKCRFLQMSNEGKQKVSKAVLSCYREDVSVLPYILPFSILFHRFCLDIKSYTNG